MQEISLVMSIRNFFRHWIMVRQARKATKKCKSGFVYCPYIPIFGPPKVIVSESDLTDMVEPLKLSDALKLPGVQEEEIRISKAIEKAKKDLRKK